MGAVRKPVVSRRKSGVSAFVTRVRREARLRRETVVLKLMGHERVFLAFDWGSDTFIFEKDAWKHLENHSPVLIVRKHYLVKGTVGYVMTLTTGNHTVAAIPLLSGQFWNLGRVPASQQQMLQGCHRLRERGGRRARSLATRCADRRGRRG